VITGTGKDENGDPLVYCGLSPENIRIMQTEGRPIRVSPERLRQMGFPHPIAIVIGAVASDAQGAHQVMEQHPAASVRTDEPENCLHCVLSPRVEVFTKEHKDQRPEQLVGNIAQVLGEFLAAQLFHNKAIEKLDASLEVAMETASKSARDLLEAWAKRPRPS
jgi:hypothetical protein